VKKNQNLMQFEESQNLDWRARMAMRIALEYSPDALREVLIDMEATQPMNPYRFIIKLSVNF
jgi:hypothetical protein